MQRLYKYVVLSVAATITATTTLAQAIEERTAPEQPITEQMIEQRVAESVANLEPDATREERRKGKQISEIRFRHNLNISIGTPSLVNSTLIHDGLNIGTDYEPWMPDNLSDELNNTRHYWGKEQVLYAINAEYLYTVKPWLSLGAKCNFGACRRNKYNGETYEITAHHRAYNAAAIFNIHFGWLRRDIVELYSSIGVGIATRIERHNGLVVPMFDATFIGLSVGRKVYGFVELGGGISGAARAGIGVRFNTYKQR